jgi:hypothetical protein
VTFSATDPGTADTTAGFTYNIDWGDGTTVQTVTGGTSTDVAHTYAAAGPFTITATATDKDGGTSTPATGLATVEASPPIVVADAGGPYAIDEGAGLTLDGSATTAGPGAVFAWDLDGDTQFDDATGPSPVVTPDQMAALGLADGPAGPLTITLQVTEGPTVDTATALLTIANVAPTATVQIAGPIVAGVPTTITVGAIDPSPVDQAGQFEYRIDFDGDGTVDLVVTGPSSVTVTHTFPTPSAVALSVVVVDKDGAAGAPDLVTVAVVPAADGQGGGSGSGGGNGTGGAVLAGTGTDFTALLLAASALLFSGTLLRTGSRKPTRRR